MSAATLPRLLATKAAAVTLSTIITLAACDDESPTAPLAPAIPDLNHATEAVSAAAANGKIAFRSDRISWRDHELFVMNPDGSGQTRVITNNTNADREPAWSPDGTKLAFTKENMVQPDIYVMNPDGTGQINLTNTSNLWEWEPAWSPNGNKIAFTRQLNTNWGVYVMNADGSGQTRITSELGHEFSPSWSPDGSKLAVTCRAGGAPGGEKDICVMNADGSGRTNLTPDTQDDFDPAWSPDGSKIAFLSGHTFGGLENYEIYVMNADGSGRTRLTMTPEYEYDPTWSPDGSKIAFVSRRDGNSEIYVMNADGSDQTNVTNNPAADAQPSWQPVPASPPPPPTNQTPDGEITSPAGNVTVQMGQSVTFAGSGTDADGTIASYAWSFPGGSPSSSSVQNPGPVTFATAGTYTAILTVTDNQGAADPTPATRTITVQSTSSGVSVAVTDAAFTPRVVTSLQGSTVTWSFQGPATHNVTDRSGMGHFASGNKAAGSQYGFTFVAAGTYQYRCTLHPTVHSGTVKVPVLVSPARGTAATSFTVTWAATVRPAGYAYDVQIKRPGTTAFVNWRAAQILRSAAFVPDAGAGTYSFRARVRKLANGKASGWSPVKSVRVS